jgi:hypothetical protein
MVMAAHLLPDDALECVTSAPRRAMGLPDDGDRVAVPATSVREAIAMAPGRRVVVACAALTQTSAAVESVRQTARRGAARTRRARAGERSTDTTTRALRLRDPRRHDAEQHPVLAPHVVLAVLEQRPPPARSSARRSASRDSRPVTARWSRVVQDMRHSRGPSLWIVSAN